MAKLFRTFFFFFRPLFNCDTQTVLYYKYTIFNKCIQQMQVVLGN